MSETKRTVRDSVFRLIFGNEVLLAQFLRDYVKHPALEGVMPEHISALPVEFSRFSDVFQEELNSDTVKQINRPGSKGELFVIDLTEHQSSVDYFMGYRLLRYKVCIWDAWIAQCRTIDPECTKKKDFLLPPIIAVVYHDGKERWTAATEFRQLVRDSELFSEDIPQVTYRVISNFDYREEDIAAKNNALAAALLVDRVRQPSEAATFAARYPELFEAIAAEPAHVRGILHDCVVALLRSANAKQNNIEEISTTFRAGGVNEMFAALEKIDLSAAYDQGHEEGHEKGRVEGRIDELKELYLEESLSRLVVSNRLVSAYGRSRDEAQRLVAAWDMERSSQRQFRPPTLG